jgi:Tol biopolymer transport system component
VITRWSPDGKTLSFETDRDGDDWDIYLMDADGSNPRPLTANSSNDYGQTWSPDGRWLVYLSNADGDDEIFIIDRDGKNQQRLTDNDYNEGLPAWAP